MSEPPKVKVRDSANLKRSNSLIGLNSLSKSINEQQDTIVNLQKHSEFLEEKLEKAVEVINQQESTIERQEKLLNDILNN